VETSVGIIGDGQLGMLLCEAAPALGLRTVMLTSAADCAAARRADRAVEGAMDDGVPSTP
jgi:5-(carboxyamino)imidazole ribonucleotide synthase